MTEVSSHDIREVIMKKKVTAIILIMTLAMSFAGCGIGIYTCKKCEETTMKAYYDMEMSKDEVLCEDCARKYWMPFPYENYRVK